MKKVLFRKEPIGRRLDFILQELARETNTLGAKSNNMNISSYGSITSNVPIANDKLQLLRDTPFPKNTSRKNIMRTEHKENKVRYEGFVLGKINLIPHMWKKGKDGKIIKQQESNRTKDPRFKRLFN